MYDYIKSLHRQFFQEPACNELRQEIEQTRQALREQLDKENRRKLLYLVDQQSALREEISLHSFLAGFQLAWGIAKELETDGLYSFEGEEERRACEKFGKQEE